MPLTPAQQQDIIDLDRQAKQILRYERDEEALLMSLAHEMTKIKGIMDGCEDDELDHYCRQYVGFYQYMELLERLALGISEGTIEVPN